MENYFCGHCNYTTTKSNHYNRHCLSKKHIANINNTKYTCEYCNKEYNKLNSLWYHKKKCKIQFDIFLEKSESMLENIVVLQVHNKLENNEEKINTIIHNNQNNISEIKKEINILIQNNEENTKILKEEIQTLNEKIENVKPNVFNLNVFLNEYCKDAMSIDTFLSQLQIQFRLNNTLEKDAINALTDALTNMEVYKRPIHCLDLKRNKVCIKDNDEWTKDINVFEKVPKYVEKMYGKEINKWEERNPGYMDNDEKMSLFIQHMAKFGQVLNSLKILRPILKITGIPKHELTNE